jgi:hypothetical protein
MRKSEDKTAEHCLSCSVKKKKWTVVKVFTTCMSTVRFLVNLLALVDKYWPKILSLFGIDTE